MKKSFILLLTAGLFLTLAVNGQNKDPWIKTDDGQISCLKINVQKETAKVVLENGEKITIPTSTILSYFKDDRLYLKESLYNGDAVFMEFVGTRDDLQLLKYLDNGTVRYFVYKGGNLYQEILDANRKEFETFFNIDL